MKPLDFLVSATLACVILVAGCSSETPPQTPGRAEPETGPPWFAETAVQRGIEFTHRSGHDGPHLMPEVPAGGGGLFDMDGDGDLDAYLLQSGSLTRAEARMPGNRLFENLGDGRFEDVTEGSGVEQSGYGMGLACGDYDNDGDVDLYVTNYGANAMLANQGDGTFRDVTAVAGVGNEEWGSSAGFFDYDRDGDLDLFVVNYVHWTPETELECYNQMGALDYCGPKNYEAPSMDVLFRNEGDGTFTDATAAAGIDQAFGNGLGFAFGDFDSDGWLDIFVANDGTLDQLWVNQKDGTFTDQALIRGCAVDLEAGVPKAGMGVTIGDIDDDGDLDLMVCNLVDESDSVYRNEGTHFTDVTARAGLGRVSRHYTRFGMGWVDFDNDGRLDLYQSNGRVMRRADVFGEDPFAEPNLLFRGVEGGKFVEVLPRGGTAEELYFTSRAAAFGDIDDDGAVDVLVVNRDGPAQLMHNVTAERGNWIRFRVVEEHGRDAEGAQLSLSAEGRTMRRDVRSGFSYLACNDPRVHFGLGDTVEVGDVTVRWVDGTTETFGPFDAGSDFVLTRGAGR